MVAAHSGHNARQGRTARGPDEAIVARGHVRLACCAIERMAIVSSRYDLAAREEGFPISRARRPAIVSGPE